MRYLTIFIVLIHFACNLSVCQELPPIRYFSPNDYHLANQNWSLSQSSQKIIYVANSGGLLRFNGINWKTYPSPNETIIRSVSVIGERIYTGCYMEFGYWQENEFGNLDYVSLSANDQLRLEEDEEFWNIIGVEEYVVFQSLKRIYIYNTVSGSFEVIDSELAIHKSFVSAGEIYFQKLGGGIFKIMGGRPVLVSDEPVFMSDEVVNIFWIDGAMHVLTRSEGFFQLHDDGRVTKLPLSASMDDFSAYSAIKLADGRIAIGTISHGLILYDIALGKVGQISQADGLGNNTVLSMMEDRDHNLWLGLDNGISFLNLNAPIKIYRDREGTLGSVYASVIHEGKIYLGTNQGLFFKSIRQNRDFKFIPGTEGQVWSLKIVQGDLICGHHLGTFLVKDGEVARIADIQGTWEVKTYNNRPNLLIQGNYDGLYVLQKLNKKWSIKNKLHGFNNSSRTFEMLDDKIFVNHEYQGVFALTVDDLLQNVIDVKVDTALRGANSSIAKYQENILFSSKSGIYKYEKAINSFLKDTLLSSIFATDEYTSGRLISDDNSFWHFTKNRISKVSSGVLSDAISVKTIPLTQEMRQEVSEFENMVRYGEGNEYLLGTSDGYLIVDMDDFLFSDFEVIIDNVFNDSEVYRAEQRLVNKRAKGHFANEENSFVISYYTPEYYQYFKSRFQFQLIGMYDEWSDWTEESFVFFENLPAGTYEFRVRARLGDKLSHNVASYTFEIAKPWYASDAMLIIYVVILILSLAMIHYVYRTYYHRKQGKLIEKSKKELEMERLRNEKEIIRIKNDQLREDYKNKSKELAASTMTMVRKNELLMQIKEKLSQVNDKKSVAPVIRVIDKNLDHDENWELFKEAFNNADSEFFHKLKAMHPDLSPNELKLCAYLRLNLSSKEIAPLFNISPRSVEIKRYRLRKKLDLSGDQNLTTYILDL